MSHREERERLGGKQPNEDHAPIQDEYPTDDQPVHVDAEGNHNEAADEESVTGSEAEDRELAKEAPGVDMRAAPREHSGFYVMLFYIIFSFISFVFMLTSSTTIAWYKSGEGESWTLWKDPAGTQWKDYPCQHKGQIFQAMQAFTIISCVLSLGCLISGILQTTGCGHMGVSLALAFITMSVELVAWSLGVHQYHKYNCPGEIAYVDHVNRLQAGFCLTIISFAFMLFAVIALGYYFNAYYSLSESSKERRSMPALGAMFLVGGCLCITAVGDAFTMWEDYSLTHKIKITFWHVEVLTQATGLSEHYSIKNYQCSQLTNMFRAGAAFGIISAAFLFVTLMLITAAVFKRVLKWAAFAVGVCSWVFLLVCWAIMIAARYKVFCPNAPPAPRTHGLTSVPLNRGEQRVDFTGFVITEGLGMIISAWCAMTLIVIFIAVKV